MKTPHTQRINKGKFRQAGMTLIEVLTSLAIFALVVGGAIALYGSASSSQSTTQFTSDLNSIRTATKSVYFGQGGYGTASLGEVLISGKKVPTTMAITGTAPNRAINHSLNGTVTVTGATSQFTVAVSNIPTAVCQGLAAMNGWDSVQVGSNAVRTPPVSPSTASSDCSAASAQTITFTGS